MDALVTVVIPTWDGRERLRRCLEALRKQTFRDFDVVVIVNGSRDDTVGMLSRYPEAQVIVNPRNLGFAAAVNQGIRSTGGDYVAVLNDDAFPEPRWLEALLRVMGSDPGLGACASLMVFAHKPDTVQSAGIAIDRAAIAWDRFRGKPVSVARKTREVFGASAGAALYRRSMLEEVGLFDERFFAYLEDVDLAWRAQIAGWRCRYVPEAVVHHLTGASLGEDSSLKKQLKARNKLWTAVKNAPAEYFPFILAYDWAAILYSLAKGDVHPLLGRWKALKGMRPFLAERRPGSPRVLEPLVPFWRVPARWGG